MMSSFIVCVDCVAAQTESPVLKTANFMQYLIANVIRTYILKREDETFTSDLDADQNHCHTYVVKTNI